MAMPAQIDQPASSGVKSSCTSSSELWKTADATAGWAKSLAMIRKTPNIP